MAASGSSSAQTARQTFKTSDGVTLSILESGRAHDTEAAPAIAFVPGWGMPASLWQPQLTGLGSRHHAIALDPRGQGESDVPAFGYTVERRATDIQEFLKPHANVVLVAWSLGVLEALQYVQMFGQGQLAGLVLVDNSVGEEPAPTSTSGAFAKELREDRGKAVRGFARAIFKTPRTDAEIDAVVASAMRMSLENSLALLSYPFPRTHWREIARGFTKPLLYVVTPQFEAQARNLEKSRPGTEVVVFKQAGHALFVDEPERFNTLVEDFVQKLSAR